jgi:flagellar L-ring protein FlgH
MTQRILALLGGLVLLPLAAAAQTAIPGTGGQPAKADTAKAPAAAPVRVRAAWLSDQQPLRVGDLLTVVLDEQTVAQESASLKAGDNRSSSMNFGLQTPTKAAAQPTKAQFSSGVQSQSGNSSQADRRGNLTGVLSVRVTAMEPGGIAHIKGGKTVTVDGRKQEITLEGLVRAADVTADNEVASSRVAEAVIEYKGKKIGPKSGIFGKILSILWP